MEYEQGFQDGVDSCDDGRGNYQDGYDDGYAKGKDIGYDEGHVDGYVEAYDNDSIYSQAEMDEQLAIARATAYQQGFEVGLAKATDTFQTTNVQGKQHSLTGYGVKGPTFG